MGYLWHTVFCRHQMSFAPFGLFLVGHFIGGLVLGGAIIPPDDQAVWIRVGCRCQFLVGLGRGGCLECTNSGPTRTRPGASATATTITTRTPLSVLSGYGSYQSKNSNDVVRTGDYLIVAIAFTRLARFHVLAVPSGGCGDGSDALWMGIAYHVKKQHVNEGGPSVIVTI